MAYQSNEMWSDERCDYIRLPQVRLPPRPDKPESYLPFQHEGYRMGLKRNDYDRVVSFPTRKPPLPERPGDGRCTAYDYGHVSVGYRDDGESHGFGDERSGPTQRIDDRDYRWPRDDHPPSHQLDYRDISDGIRQKPMYPNYDRERSPLKRDSPYFREMPVGRRESPHSKSGSIVSSRSYSPDRSKACAFHQTQPSRSTSSFHKRNISEQDKSTPEDCGTLRNSMEVGMRDGVSRRTLLGKERTASQPLHTSRDVFPAGTKMVPPSKALDKSSRLSEKELAEAPSTWGVEKVEKGDMSTVPKISEYEAAAPEPLYLEPRVETGADITDNKELFEETQHVARSKAVAAKTKEIEQVPSGFQDSVSGCTKDQGMSGHQPTPDPILKQGEALTLDDPPAPTPPRSKRPCRPEGTVAKVTWGMLKSLSKEAQCQLKMAGHPQTPEMFLLAVFTQLAKNSHAVYQAQNP